MGREARAVELRREGWTVEAIAAEVGANERTVYRWTQGVAPRRYVSLTESQVEWARAMMLEGCPIGEVAESLGVRRDVVRRDAGMTTPWSVSMEWRELKKQFAALP